MFGWLFRNRVFLFAWAAVTGFLFALVWKQYEQAVHRTLTHYRITPSSFDYQWAYDTWLSSLGLVSAPLRTHNVTTDTSAPAAAPSPSTLTEDRWLTDRIPVYCVVLSRKLKQTRAVKLTWAKHCNGVAFFGSFADRGVPVRKVTGADEERRGADVECEALRETWREHRRNFRWVLVATDRTYAVVENLRYMVAGLDSSEPHYLGHAFRDYDGDFNVEDAGYVLSWGALEAFNRRFAASDSCGRSEFWSSGDRTVGKALQELGVRPRDTRDTLERSRFLPFSLDKLLIPGSISLFNRYWRESVFLSPEGSGCCSDFAVTFSDVTPDKMHMMEYVIYHLKPVSHRWPPLPPDPISHAASTRASVISSSTPKKKVSPTGKAFVLELTAAKPTAAPLLKVVSDVPAIKKVPSSDLDDEDNEVSGNALDEPATMASPTKQNPADVVSDGREVLESVTDGDSPRMAATTDYEVVQEDEYFDELGDKEGQDNRVAKN